MWLVGKHLITCKDVHTFPVKMLKLGSFEVCRNEKQPEKGWFKITKHGIYFKIWSVLSAAMFSCVATDFFTKESEAAIQSELHALTVYSSWLD